MATISQEVIGTKAALDEIETRMAAYRQALLSRMGGKTSIYTADVVPVSCGEIDLVEALISGLATRVFGTAPEEGVWTSLKLYCDRNHVEVSDNLTQHDAEYCRWALLWVQKSRLYLTTIAAAASVVDSSSNVSGSSISKNSSDLAQLRSHPRTDFGQYFGQLILRPLEDGRRMQLTEVFGFNDANDVRWIVPKDAVIDGASIPSSLWSVLGGPFEGLYRDASVVHDYYCSVRLKPWRQVHRVFYDAMRASGVSELRAKVMYAAVRFGGPRWSDMDIANNKVPRVDQNGLNFSINHTRFDKDVYKTIRVGQETLEEVAESDEFLGGISTEALLHLGPLEEVFATYEPSLTELERAIDNAVSLVDIATRSEPSQRVVESGSLTQDDGNVEIKSHSAFDDNAKAAVDIDPSRMEHVEFRDAALEAAIRKKMNQHGGPITIGQMRDLEGLDLRDEPIQDISDLELCTNLRFLSIERTEVRNLGPISKLDLLETLSVNCTPVADLTPIIALTNLRDLFVGKTNVSDLSPLVSLRKLRLLSLAFSPVSDILPLVDLRSNGGLNKGTVYLWSTPLTDYSRHIHIPRLRELDVEVSF